MPFFAIEISGIVLCVADGRAAAISAISPAIITELIADDHTICLLVSPRMRTSTPADSSRFIDTYVKQLIIIGSDISTHSSSGAVRQATARNTIINGTTRTLALTRPLPRLSMYADSSPKKTPNGKRSPVR